MLTVQIIPRVTKESFRVVVFLKDGDTNIDADISIVARFADGGEIIFLLAPKSEKPDFMYPETSSKFLHRLEKGIYVTQSKNKKLLSAKEITVNARFKGKAVKKSMRIHDI